MQKIEKIRKILEKKFSSLFVYLFFEVSCSRLCQIHYIYTRLYSFKITQRTRKILTWNPVGAFCATCTATGYPFSMLVTLTAPRTGKVLLSSVLVHAQPLSFSSLRSGLFAGNHGFLSRGFFFFFKTGILIHSNVLNTSIGYKQRYELQYSGFNSLTKLVLPTLNQEIGGFKPTQFEESSRSCFLMGMMLTFQSAL